MHGRGFCVHLLNEIRLDLLCGVFVFVLLGHVGPELVHRDTAAVSCECYVNKMCALIGNFDSLVYFLVMVLMSNKYNNHILMHGVGDGSKSKQDYQ